MVRERDHSESDEEEILPPNPSALIESLRSFGYLPSTAIADLVDNSITAGAKQIDIHLHWAGRHSFASISDDGAGMTEDTLRAAMRAGSSNPLASRTKSDLGRFGLGLKTASFSQARTLTVISRKSGDQPAIRRWDLDHVGKRNEWALLKTAPVGYDDQVDGALRRRHGTTVLWTNLDRIVDDRSVEDPRARKAFLSVAAAVKSHCEMVFHQFMMDKDLSITVNGQRCEPWDPFLSKHRSTERLQDESMQVTLPNGTVQELVVQPFVLPHRSKLSEEEARIAAGPRGWNLQQGFYLYRAKRLIVPGNWFNPDLKPEEHHKLARIRVEITQEMDAQWNLDVIKSRARPPAALRDEFLRVARATRIKAQEVYRHRGRRSVGHGTTEKAAPVWIARTEEGNVEYAVNREHAAIRQLTEMLGDAELRRRFEGVLRLAEGNLPIAHILSSGFEDEARLDNSPELDPDILELLHDLFCQLRATGLEDHRIRALLMSQEPFNRFPDAVAHLSDGACQ